jgi:hypothetical protein
MWQPGSIRPDRDRFECARARPYLGAQDFAEKWGQHRRDASEARVPTQRQGPDRLRDQPSWRQTHVGLVPAESPRRGGKPFVLISGRPAATNSRSAVGRSCGAGGTPPRRRARPAASSSTCRRRRRAARAGVSRPVLLAPLLVQRGDVLRVALSPLTHCLGVARPTPGVDAIPVVRIRPKPLDWEPLPARAAPLAGDRCRQVSVSVLFAADWARV